MFSAIWRFTFTTDASSAAPQLKDPVTAQIDRACRLRQFQSHRHSPATSGIEKINDDPSLGSLSLPLTDCALTSTAPASRQKSVTW